MLSSLRSHKRGAAMVPPLGLLHIGRAAHCLWAYPPNVGRTAHRHVHVHRRTTVAYPTVADAMIETKKPMTHLYERILKSACGRTVLSYGDASRNSPGPGGAV